VQRGFDDLDNEPFLEPAVSPEDTQPRKPVDSAVALDQEPDIAPEDTQPRPDADEHVNDQGAEPAGGCGSPLLVGAVILALACLFATSIALSGYAGWRDGVEIAQTKKSGTLVSYLGDQAALAAEDCKQERYELCFERCEYVVKHQEVPFSFGAEACIAQAGMALSATPTPTVTATVQPPTPTPSPSLPPNDSSGLPSPEELFARSQEAVRTEDYENAMKWLEALRGRDADFRRKEVEDMLVKTYLALGTRYKQEGRLSEMIIVIKKAEKLRSLDDTDWAFTINVADLYLSAKGYLDAENYTMADKVFSRLMTMAPTYLDTKDLACEAFRHTGNSAQLKQWCS
jgi:tetratricopeptide (TPR) repeat protein